MQLNHGGFFISIKTPPRPPLQSVLPRKPFCTSSSLKLPETLHDETLKALEWSSVCNQVAAFASTAMGSSVARNGGLPLGRTPAESQKLLDQTTAATLLPRPLDFSGIEDVSEIIDASVSSGKWVSIGELCAVGRTLRAARGVLEQLEEVALDGQSLERFSPLLEVLDNSSFLMDLERRIGFCIDCGFSRILDQASEKLETIRTKRKKNMENLDSLLERVATRIFQAGGIDRPLVTRRRSRMCVGVRASHKSLLPDGIVLNVSSSGITRFVEPREAVELNNMEVRLSDSEGAEELVILTLLTAEIAESELEIKCLLDRVMEIDLACARAAHGRWINGVCPVLFLEDRGGFSLVDVEGIQHPLLLQSSLGTLPDKEDGVMNSERLSHISNFPVPINIKIGYGVKVVVISGPNTGGKTASMKTLGLASLMSKAGMYVAAKECPKIPWFDLILADIGDHQSLEQNLSTFSGHIQRICQILEVASKESLVLIDEIGSGTDPSEGVALSTSILCYLKNRVKLAVVTSHYEDLTRLKEEDGQFENAAMGFSLETLQPTYQMLWGARGDSNALSIANSIGFDKNIIECAKIWIEKLKPENQETRQSLLYESLLQERNKLEAQSTKAAALHSEILNLYHEIECEAEDLPEREAALKAKETQRIQREIENAKSEMETVVLQFDNQLKTASTNQVNSLIRKAESAIATITEVHCPADAAFAIEDTSPFTPQVGERVRVKGLGDKLVTVIESQENDDTVLVQSKKMRIRVSKTNIRALPNSELNAASASVSNHKQQHSRRRNFRKPLENNEHEHASYGPLVQTSKNTVDLRGMRVEEASDHLNLMISTREQYSVIFVIHGMGTGVVKECALEILRNHPRVAKFEPESSMNYGCTVAYVK